MRPALRQMLRLTWRAADLALDVEGRSAASPMVAHRATEIQAIMRERAEIMGGLVGREPGRAGLVDQEGRACAREGMLAALTGREESACPYEAGPERKAWTWGYRRASDVAIEGALVYAAGGA